MKAKTPVPGIPDDTYTEKREGGVNLGLGVGYSIGDFGINFSASALGLGSQATKTQAGNPLSPANGTSTTKVVQPVKSAIYLGTSYKSIGVQFGVKMQGENKTITSGFTPVLVDGVDTANTTTTGEDSTIQFGFGVYASKGFGKATIAIGLGYTSPVLWTAGEDKAPLSYTGAGTAASPFVPVRDGSGTSSSRWNISVPIKFRVEF